MLRRAFLIAALVAALACPAFGGVTTVPRYKVGGATTPSNHFICGTFGTDLAGITTMTTGDSAFCADTGLIYYYDGSAWQVPQTVASTLLFVSTADATVTNTSPLSLVGTGVGSMTLPSAYLNTVGKTIRLTCRGFITNTGTPTLQIVIKINTVTVYDTGALTMTTIGATTRYFTLDAYFTVRTTGAPGTMVGQATFAYGTAQTAGTRVDQATYATSNSVTTTGTALVEAIATWGTNNAQNTMTTTVCTLEGLN